jgi:carboxypeptidase C (cathepsin A)
MTAPLTSAMVDHLARTLNWRVSDMRYNLLNGGVNGGWRWGTGRRQWEAVSELRQALALDANLRLLIAHGFTDLVTPYFMTKLILDQLPEYAGDRRVGLEVYPGGHMFYTRDASRVAFRAAVERLYGDAIQAREQAAPSR